MAQAYWLRKAGTGFHLILFIRYFRTLNRMPWFLAKALPPHNHLAALKVLMSFWVSLPFYFLKAVANWPPIWMLFSCLNAAPVRRNNAWVRYPWASLASIGFGVMFWYLNQNQHKTTLALDSSQSNIEIHMLNKLIQTWCWSCSVRFKWMPDGMGFFFFQFQTSCVKFSRVEAGSK